jgi:glycosyltransferase involved in cell wall biosynthesis
VVASDTAPVREVLKHGETGLLADFFSPREIAALVERVLNQPERHKHLGLLARAEVVRDYDATRSVARYLQLIDRLLSNGAQMRSLYP